MSGLAAILHLDGRPAEPREIERMLDAIAHRGPDGSGIWRGGPTALGHRMFHTTPESLDETQPHCDETGDYRLIFDGRIDNVAELRHALEERGLRPRATTDAEIVLRSYQCWGEPFVEKLLGDFALAIWDARAETLLCARDALGVKPLYYYGDGRIFVCGSEINALLSHPEIPRQPNEGMVGEYLAYQRATGGETLFRSIMRLRPGHVLTASQGRISVRRYFDLDPRKELRYRNDDEYAEHFLDIFKESVRCRMRCAGPLAMQLSGGLDSSSIVCTAHKFFDGGPSSPSRFKTYSLTFPGLVDDETDYINEALRHTGVRGDLLTHNPTGEFDNFEWVRKHRDFPEYPNHLSMLRLWEAVRGDGARVLLTGLGGDECFSGCLDDIADLLRRGELRSLMRQVRIDSLQSPVRFGEKIGALHIFLAKGLLPLLPRAMQRMAHGLAGHKQSFPPWIDPGFARRIALEERLKPTPARAATFMILCITAISLWSWTKSSIHTLETAWKRATLFWIGASSSSHGRFPRINAGDSARSGG